MILIFALFIDLLLLIEQNQYLCTRNLRIPDGSSAAPRNYRGFFRLVEQYYKISIHPHLIVEIQSMNLEKEFSDFLLLKIKYRNGCFYNYTQSSIAKVMGWSRTKVRRLLAIFLKHGWCFIHNSNLCFKNLHKIYNADKKHRSKKSILLNLKQKTKEQIFAQLTLNILATKQRHIKKAIAVRTDLNSRNPSTFKSARKSERKFRRQLTNGEKSNHIRTSLICLGKFFNRSAMTASRRIKLLRDQKLIHTVRSSTRLFPCTVTAGHHYSQYKGLGSVYVKDGYLYKRNSNEYKII